MVKKLGPQISWERDNTFSSPHQRSAVDVLVEDVLLPSADLKAADIDKDKRSQRSAHMVALEMREAETAALKSEAAAHKAELSAPLLHNRHDSSSVSAGSDGAKDEPPDLRLYFLAMCTLVHNEAQWLPEWIEASALVGVQHFFLYDDASSDALGWALAPYQRRGLVTLYPNFTTSDKFLRDATLDTSSGTCTRPDARTGGCAFPAQAAMVRSCVREHIWKAHWMALLDVDEFLIRPSSWSDSLNRWLDGAGKDVGLVELEGVSMLSPADDAAGEPKLTIGSTMRTVGKYGWPGRNQYGAALGTQKKVIVRPEAVSATYYASIHGDFALEPGWQRSPVLGPETGPRFAHYKFRSLRTRNGQDYLGPAAARAEKEHRIAMWRRWVPLAIADTEGTGTLSTMHALVAPTLVALSTTWAGVEPLLIDRVRQLREQGDAFLRRRKVVLVSAARSGSTTIGHFAFAGTTGANLTEFDYWYEPCRCRARGEPDNRQLFGRACAERVARLLSCTLTLDDFEQLLADESAMKHGSHPWASKEGAGWVAGWVSEQEEDRVALYNKMMRSCWVRDVAIKSVRLDDLQAPAVIYDQYAKTSSRVTMGSRESDVSTILLLRHPADVAASRLTLPEVLRNSWQWSLGDQQGGTLGTVSHVCAHMDALLSRPAKLTVRLEDFVADPRAELHHIYQVIGLHNASAIAEVVHQNAHRERCSGSRKSRFAPLYPSAAGMTGCGVVSTRGRSNHQMNMHVSSLRARRGSLWEKMRDDCAGLLRQNYASVHPKSTATGLMDEPGTAHEADRAAGSQTTTRGLSYSSLKTLVPVPQHKLLFCIIEKNGATVQSVLVADLMGFHAETDRAMLQGTVGAVRGSRRGNDSRDKNMSLGRFPWDATSQLRSVMSSPGAHMATVSAQVLSAHWRKIVVLRHPVERFVSAYRDKCVLELQLLNHGLAGEDRCLKAFRIPRRAQDSITMRTIAERLHIGANDPHWTPQSEFCGGLGTSIGYFHRVRFDNLMEGVVELLRSWRLPAKALARARLTLSVDYASARLRKAAMNHRTNASSTALDQGTRQLVEWFYRNDYPLLGLPMPTPKLFTAPTRGE